MMVVVSCLAAFVEVGNKIARFLIAATSESALISGKSLGYDVYELGHSLWQLAAAAGAGLVTPYRPFKLPANSVVWAMARRPEDVGMPKELRRDAYSSGIFPDAELLADGRVAVRVVWHVVMATRSWTTP
jgi:hypothetical protein